MQSLKKNGYLLAVIGYMLAAGQTASAQCPVAAFCNPTNPAAANLSFGIGIRTVTLGTLNHVTPANSTGGTQNGYQNYSCTTGTTLTAALNYPISITTGPNTTENVRVYIDYNNDGVFSVPAELAFSSNTALVHNGSLTAPATTVTNTPLRMRVVSEFTGASALPSPCMALEYGQAEDYHVIVIPNTQPPLPDFSTQEPYSCDGTVSFTDLSQNAPTTWSWNFGDAASGAANTSSLPNPSHTFSAPGVYTISLTGCNANGCSTMVKNDYVTFNADLPVAATCTPATLSYCCGYGIYNVTLGTINHTSADGIAGYQDFTCPVRTTLAEGVTYPISITTSPGNNQNTGVWIDFNNDGSFSSTESVFSSLNSLNLSGNITIPLGSVLNTPLRMRVVSDFAGSTVSACGNPQSGQAEDYTVTIVPNTFPPVAGFGIAPFATCDTIRQFTNTSQLNLSSPATTYQWNFGDGNTSTDTNPTHAYATATGIYTVTLVACNAFGCDTLAMPNAVTINNPCLNYCTPANNNNATQWLSQVELNNISNLSGAGTGGYSNFGNISTNIVRGTATNFTVSLGTQTQRTISIWVDYNRNGVFEQTERLVNATAQLLPSGFRGISGNLTIPVGPELGATRMRVIMRNIFNGTDPCVSNAANTDIEDYTLFMQPTPPAAAFTSNQGGICTGVISFQDQSVNLPTTWTWDFGDGSPTVNSQNPTHTYQTTSPASYTVTLTACNTAGCDTVSLPNYVVITVPCTVPYCPSEGHTNTNQHISSVSLNSINNTSGANANGYGNFTSLNTEVLIGALSQLTVQTPDNQPFWGVSAWIDFNHNATFDTNERLVFGAGITLPGGAVARTSNFTVPANAVPGPNRLRIIGRQGTNTNPCAMNLNSAETEDYSVTLVTTAANDVGITAINSPVSACALSASEQICVVLKNFGTSPQTNIPVRFSIAAFQSPVEIVPGTLAPGDSVMYCFTTTANLAIAGNYNIQVQTALTADAQLSNNGITTAVQSYPLPNANFLYSANGLTYTFNTNATIGTAFSWNFGDGNTSAAASPVHAFAGAGTYIVTLTATSPEGCVSVSSQTLSGVSGLNEEVNTQVKVSPNPTTGFVSINYPEDEQANIEITNALGQVVHSASGNSGRYSLNLNQTAKGIYQVKVKLKNQLVIRKLIVQ